MHGKYVKLVENTLSPQVDAIDEAEQEFSSAETSISQVSGLHQYLLKQGVPQPNTIVLDWGGGKYDKTKDLYESSVEGLEFLVYDKFNRTTEHNKEVLKKIKANKGSDMTTCANVLNVIKEKDIRLKLISEIKKYMKKGTKLYISVYNATKSPNYQETEEFVGQPTSKGWQNAQPAKFYLPEVQASFPDAIVKKGIIVATK